MKISVVVLCILLTVCAGAQSSHTAARPRILGIDHVSFYTTQPDAAKSTYSGTLGLVSAAPIETGGRARYMVGKQWVGYSNAPDPKAIDRMDHVAFATDNIAELRNYLMMNGVRTSEVEERSDHSRALTVSDPEGHRIEFVERGKEAAPEPPAETAASRHLIHTGFLVRSRAAMDRFYRDLLGFRLYWHGGMQPGKTDWVAMQVPDGTDWLEYMLGFSEPLNLREIGVLNHISLGVADMKKAQALLEAHGWKPHDDEKAQMGKDGKWQLNVFDGDLSRIELMEFRPVKKPCCAEFTGPHPRE